MDRRMLHALQLFFQGPYENGCVLGPEDSAEITIIDLDMYGGRDLCAEHRERYPGRPMILLSLAQADTEDALFVRKPIDRARLVAALDRARAMVRNRVSGSLPSAKAADVPRPNPSDGGRLSPGPTRAVKRAVDNTGSGQSRVQGETPSRCILHPCTAPERA